MADEDDDDDEEEEEGGVDFMEAERELASCVFKTKCDLGGVLVDGDRSSWGSWEGR